MTILISITSLGKQTTTQTKRTIFDIRYTCTSLRTKILCRAVQSNREFRKFCKTFTQSSFRRLI